MLKLDFGDMVSASIDFDGEMDTYTFSTNAGDSVLIRMSESSVFLNPGV